MEDPKVRIVEWRYYLPNCPADLEVTDNEILGILTVDETVDERQQQLVERYKALKIQDDYEGDTTRWFAWREENGQPYTEEQKREAITLADERYLEAREDFDVYYDGYFNHNDYELDPDQPLY